MLMKDLAPGHHPKTNYELELFIPNFFILSISVIKCTTKGILNKQ